MRHVAHNIELYIAIIISVVILITTVLGEATIFGVSTAVITVNVTLLVLTLLSIGIVRDRLQRSALDLRVTELGNQLSNVFKASISRLTRWNALQDSFKAELKQAQLLESIVVDPEQYFQTYHTELQTLLERGGAVRLIHMPPGSAEDLFPGIDLNRRLVNFRTYPTQNAFPGLQDGQLEVREKRYAPTSTISIVTRDTSQPEQAIIYVTLRGLRGSGRPAMVLTQGDDFLFTFFKDEFTRLWDLDAAMMQPSPNA
jgi:hypothetical protein